MITKEITNSALCKVAEDVATEYGFIFLEKNRETSLDTHFWGNICQDPDYFIDNVLFIKPEFDDDKEARQTEYDKGLPNSRWRIYIDMHFCRPRLNVWISEDECAFVTMTNDGKIAATQTFGTKGVPLLLKLTAKIQWELIDK